MGFWKRRPTVEPLTPDPDLERSKQRADIAYNAAVRRGEVVEQMTSTLADRRKKNHFGDSIDISFTPRRSRHA